MRPVVSILMPMASGARPGSRFSYPFIPSHPPVSLNWPAFIANTAAGGAESIVQRPVMPFESVASVSAKRTREGST